LRELLEQYLIGQYIIPMTWDNCLNSREDLVSLLRGWLQVTDSDTIGDPNNGIGVTPLIRLQIGDNRYVLNQDTRRVGVKMFIENARNGNIWHCSETNRVSNDLNGERIANLHMYRVN
jgi:hypothetical protein